MRRPDLRMMIEAVRHNGALHFYTRSQMDKLLESTRPFKAAI